MLKAIKRISVPALAYLCLLAAFVSLGLFTAALATGSDLAVVAGVGLIACFATSVAGFRAGARKLAKSREAGGSSNNVSIFSTPLKRDQVDRYLESYRCEKGRTAPTGRVLTVLVGGESTDRHATPAA